TGVIETLHGQPGDTVQTGAPLVEFRLDAAPQAAPQPKRPDPKKPDDSGTVVGSMPTSEEELFETAVAGGNGATHRERVRAAPAVRALAKRLGVDLARLSGSGRGGLITVDDVMNSTGPGALQTAATVGALRAAPAARAPAAADAAAS